MNGLSFGIQGPNQTPCKGERSRRQHASKEESGEEEKETLTGEVISPGQVLPRPPRRSTSAEAFVLQSLALSGGLLARSRAPAALVMTKVKEPARDDNGKDGQSGRRQVATGFANG